MPALRTYRVFISHCWEYSSEYDRLVDWLRQEKFFKWKNLSVPAHRAIAEDTELEFHLRRRLGDADILVVIAGMEIAQRHWVQWEIKWARIRGIPIVGIRPRGARRIPRIVRDAKCPIVGWRRATVTRAIRDLALDRG